MQTAYAVLGGDRRQLRLAELLRQDGAQVYIDGFDSVAGLEQSSLEQAVTADVVILPLPVSMDGTTLYRPLSSSRHALEDL